MSKCKSPKEFENHIKKELNQFLVPCCYIRNGKLNSKQLIKRIKALKIVEAQMNRMIRSLDALNKSVKE